MGGVGKGGGGGWNGYFNSHLMNVWSPCIWGVFSNTNRLFGRLLPLSAEWANLVRSLKPLWKYHNSCYTCMANFSIFVQFSLLIYCKTLTNIFFIGCNFLKDTTVRIFTRLLFLELHISCTCTGILVWEIIFRTQLPCIYDLLTSWISTKIKPSQRKGALHKENLLVTRNAYLLKLSMYMHDNEINGHSVLSTCNRSNIQ